MNSLFCFFLQLGRRSASIASLLAAVATDNLMSKGEFSQAQMKINGREKLTTCWSMWKADSTYKLIRKISNFRGLLKRLPEILVMCVCRRCSIFPQIISPIAMSIYLIAAHDKRALLCCSESRRIRLKFIFKAEARRKVGDIASFILD